MINRDQFASIGVYAAVLSAIYQLLTLFVQVFGIANSPTPSAISQFILLFVLLSLGTALPFYPDLRQNVTRLLKGRMFWTAISIGFALTWIAVINGQVHRLEAQQSSAAIGLAEVETSVPAIQTNQSDQAQRVMRTSLVTTGQLEDMLASQSAQSTAISALFTLVPPTPPPSPTPSGPAPYISEDFNSPPLDRNKWQISSCGPSDLDQSFGSLKIGLESSGDDDARSCSLSARLEGGSVMRVLADFILDASTSETGFVGIYTTCGPKTLNVLIGESWIALAAETLDSKFVEFVNDLPFNARLELVWTGSEARVTSVYSGRSQSIPCTEPPQYVRLGASLRSLGKLRAELDNISIWTE